MAYHGKKKPVVKREMGPHLDAIPFKNADIKKIMMGRGAGASGEFGTVFKTKKPESKA